MKWLDKSYYLRHILSLLSGKFILDFFPSLLAIYPSPRYFVYLVRSLTLWKRGVNFHSYPKSLISTG